MPDRRHIPPHAAHALSGGVARLAASGGTCSRAAAAKRDHELQSSSRCRSFSTWRPCSLMCWGTEGGPAAHNNCAKRPSPYPAGDQTHTSKSPLLQLVALRSFVLDLVTVLLSISIVSMEREMILASGKHRYAFKMSSDLGTEMIAACERLGQPLSVFIRRAVEARLAAIAVEHRPRPKPGPRPRARAHGEGHSVSAAV